MIDRLNDAPVLENMETLLKLSHLDKRPNLPNSSSFTAEILDILHACNAEIFQGWRRDPSEAVDDQFQEPIIDGLLDERTIAGATVVADELTKVLRCGSGVNAVVFSGCGTSGRLGFMAARRLKWIVDHGGV